MPASELSRLLAPEAARSLGALRGARVLVTGGSGFLGGWALAALALADQELGLGLRLSVLTRDPARCAARLPIQLGRVTIIDGDVSVLPRGIPPPTHVLHAAAPPHVGTPAEEFDRVIVEGTRRLLAACAGWGTRRFLFLSSGAVYGPSRHRSLSEDDELSGVATPYGEAKRRAEALCTAASWIETVRARGFAFLGPGLPLDGSFAAGNFLRDAARGGPIRLSSTGRSVRTYLDAREAGSWLAVMLAAGSDGAVYNLGGADRLSVAELARRIARAAGLDEAAVELGVEAGADAYVPDLARARNGLALSPRVAINDSIVDALFWARANLPKR